MGKKKVKTESTTKPVYDTEIKGAYNNLNNAYETSKPGIARVSGNLMDLSDNLLGRYYDGDPTIDAAKGFLTNTLNADSAENPYLDDMVAQTNDNVRNQMQAQMGSRGLTGSSDYYGLISKGLGQNETNLRYTDYNNREQMKLQAAGMTPGVLAGEYLPVAAAMQAGSQGAMLPSQAALAYSAGVGGLLGPYTNQKGTQTQSGGFFGDLLLSGIGAAGAAASGGAFCDARLKENVRRIGQTDAGVPLYMFNYVGSDAPTIGPMAQEVAAMQPEALGPEVDGYMTIRTGELH